MNHILPPLTKDLIEAFAASANLWLARLLAVLLSPRAAGRGRRLRRLVQVGERWVEHIVFIMAGRRIGALARKRRIAKSYVVERPGFRIAVGDNRLLWKSARIRLRRGSLIQRVQRLLAVLACPERYVARYAKRLARGLCFRRLVACAPGAQALTSLDVCHVAFADSS